MTCMKPRILVVDDEAGRAQRARRRAARRGLRRRGRRQRGGLPRPAARGRRYDVDPARHLAAGHRRPGDARSACATARSTLPVVMISGHGNIESAVQGHPSSARSTSSRSRCRSRRPCSS
ncbi:MAG: hypothetical protein MZW92_53860 [Comamonadaceae bacterium]|nr:hypothetical protein [Comamonadaceae bacterium]